MSHNENKKVISNGIGALITVFAIAIVFIAIFTYPTMWLWNTLIPELFNGPEMTFWQTFGLMVLLRLLIPTSIKDN